MGVSVLHLDVYLQLLRLTTLISNKLSNNSNRSTCSHHSTTIISSSTIIHMDFNQYPKTIILHSILSLLRLYSSYNSSDTTIGRCQQTVACPA